LGNPKCVERIDENIEDETAAESERSGLDMPVVIGAESDYLLLVESAVRRNSLSRPQRGPVRRGYDRSTSAYF
jgi:hypothetical protein